MPRALLPVAGALLAFIRRSEVRPGSRTVQTLALAGSLSSRESSRFPLTLDDGTEIRLTQANSIGEHVLRARQWFEANSARDTPRRGVSTAFGPYQTLAGTRPGVRPARAFDEFLERAGLTLEDPFSIENQDLLGLAAWANVNGGGSVANLRAGNIDRLVETLANTFASIPRPDGTNMFTGLNGNRVRASVDETLQVVTDLVTAVGGLPRLSATAMRSSPVLVRQLQSLINGILGADDTKLDVDGVPGPLTSNAFRRIFRRSPDLSTAGLTQFFADIRQLLR